MKDNIKITILKSFIVYLKNNKIYDTFFHEISTDKSWFFRKKSIRYSSYTPHEFIQSIIENNDIRLVFVNAFEWGNSDKGYDFWYDIHNKWYQIVKDIDINKIGEDYIISGRVRQ